MEDRYGSGVGSPGHGRIDDVLERTDLAQLLDELAVPAAGAMRGHRWHCPLSTHDDRHPSVSMFSDHSGHQRFRCWSGDDTHRGDAIDLVMAVRGCSRVDAVGWLAGRLGLEPTEVSRPLRRPSPASAPQRQLTDPDPAVIRYVEMCERMLWTVGGAAVRRWLAGRGFDDELLRVNHVGADPGRSLLPRRRGLPPGSAVAAVFPALDEGGAVRYVQARSLEPGDGPKYFNPAAALAVNPRLAWTAMVQEPTNGVVVVCEGIPDALTAAQAGFHAVAVLGSHAPDAQVALRLAMRARRDRGELVAIIDSDDAGRAWGHRLAGLLLDHGHRLTVIEPPIPAGDLNSWAQREPCWTATIEAHTRSTDPTRHERGRPSQADFGIDMW
jgi:DNA primase